MAKIILVPLDGSEISKELVRISDEWAQRQGVELFFLHVGAKGETDGTKHHQQFTDYLKNLNIASEYRYSYRPGTSYQEIIAVEKEIQASLIIMGAHNHTMLGRLFLGSNTKYVLHHCQCPLYVYKQQKLLFDKKIVVPIDFSEINRPVVKLADEWAQRTGADLYFIRVDTYPKESLSYHHPEIKVALETFTQAHLEEQKRIEKEVESQEAILKNFVSDCQVQSQYHCMHKFGKPYQKILELQKYIDAGLIMMAAHSHTMLDRLLTGSNTDFLLNHAECSMYIHKTVAD